VFVLDTNVLSEVIRQRPSPGVIRRLLESSSSALFASELTRHELRFGAALRPDAPAFWGRLQRDVLPLVTWLAVTEHDSMRAAEIAAQQRLSGRPSGTIGPLIAATALVQGMPLVTRNVQHFQHVTGLEVQNWV
jgi:predicted nucleic acid-binding protein